MMGHTARSRWLTRRAFVRETGVGTAAFVVAPTLLAAETKHATPAERIDCARQRPYWKDAKPFPFVSARLGNFHDSPFGDAGCAFRMGQAYDLVSDSGAIEKLSRSTGRNVRAEIERDLLYEAARHTLETPHPPTNYDGARIMGLGLAGRLLDEPEFVSAAYGIYRTLIDNCFTWSSQWRPPTPGGESGWATVCSQSAR